MVDTGTIALFAWALVVALTIEIIAYLVIF